MPKFRKLNLSTEKSTAILFTSRFLRHKNEKVPNITLGPMLTFSKNGTVINTRLKNRNNVLKSIASTTWGFGKENSYPQIYSTNMVALNMPIATHPCSKLMKQDNTARHFKLVHTQSVSHLKLLSQSRPECFVPIASEEIASLRRVDEKLSFSVPFRLVLFTKAILT